MGLFLGWPGAAAPSAPALIGAGCHSTNLNILNATSTELLSYNVVTFNFYKLLHSYATLCKHAFPEVQRNLMKKIKFIEKYQQPAHSALLRF